MGYITLCLFKLISIYITLTLQEHVKVTLFYETLCPYSLEFINEQLYPGYQKLGDALILDLVPFGKAKVKNKHGKISITCQHGPKECYGNKLHACSIKNNTQDIWMNFIGCNMATENPFDKEVAEKCAKSNKLSWTKLKTCADGEEANNLLQQYGKRTEEANVRYVPYIWFNDVFNETLEDMARDSFVETVCDLFADKPNGC